MSRQIADIEASLEVLNKKTDYLTSFMALANECMLDAEDEPEYLSFWSKLDKLTKMRNKVRIKKLTTMAFLSVKKAELRAANLFRVESSHDE